MKQIVLALALTLMATGAVLAGRADEPGGTKDKCEMIENAKWSGKAEKCVCNPGFKWNAAKTECVQK